MFSDTPLGREAELHVEPRTFPGPRHILRPSHSSQTPCSARVWEASAVSSQPQGMRESNGLAMCSLKLHNPSNPSVWLTSGYVTVASLEML